MRTPLPIVLVTTWSIQAVASILTQPATASASPPACSLGRQFDTVLLPSARGIECGDSLFVNHDWSFENGYAWSFSGIVPPDYGAFGEGLDLGSGDVTCGAFWFTQVGLYFGSPIDVYVWDGGVSGPPGAVLWYGCCISIPGAIGMWPQVSQHDIEIGLPIAGAVTIGFWANFSASVNEFLVCADENGPGGHPWTNIAPGIGYPTGWHNPRVVWGLTRSLGLGLYFVAAITPVEPYTWGHIKSLYARAPSDELEPQGGAHMVP